MAREDDVRLIAAQEKALAFEAFDEAVAFRLGVAIRDVALTRGQGIATEIRTGLRPLFYSALPGSTADNANWLRRKSNLVHLVYKSSYRVVLEKTQPEDYFTPRRGLDNADYVYAGGGFPIWVRSAGMIGSVCVSGLPEREDHNLVVEALCQVLGADHAALRLPPE